MMKNTGPVEITDEALVAQAQNGSKNAMGELYSRYHMSVFNKCMSFTKNADEASDLAQDVMLRVMEMIESFRGNAKFSTWLYSVTFNYCTDTVRKMKGKYFEDISVNYTIVDDSEDKVQESISYEIKEEKACKALMTLPKEELELLLMKYQMNRSIRELQLLLNLSASAVKMRLKRARAKAVYANYTL